MTKSIVLAIILIFIGSISSMAQVMPDTVFPWGAYSNWGWGQNRLAEMKDTLGFNMIALAWDGTNDNGEAVASGTYIARVFQWGQSAGDFPVKITLIK